MTVRALLSELIEAALQELIDYRLTHVSLPIPVLLGAGARRYRSPLRKQTGTHRADVPKSFP